MLSDGWSTPSRPLRARQRRPRAWSTRELACDEAREHDWERSVSCPHSKAAGSPRYTRPCRYPDAGSFRSFFSRSAVPGCGLVEDMGMQYNPNAQSIFGC